MIKHLTVTDALAEADALAINPDSSVREAALWTLAEAVRAELAPLPGGEAMAAEAERAARTMAPPVPGITANGGFTVRAVIHVHDAVPGLLEAWLVACEAGDGRWVTWNAYRRDGSQAGQLSYDGGHYFPSVAGTKVNRQAAMADLAVRAGMVGDIAEHIAREVTGSSLSTAEDRRMAARLLKWAGR